MSEVLTRENFDPHVNKIFRINGGDHALTLVRIEARAIDEAERALGLREPFNLIFRGNPGNVLREGTYALACEDGTAFELYVIPVHTPLPGHQDYQSSFN